MKADMTGRIFDIQHFSLSDGPGIRTAVFFKGCPLACKWCHNPESRSPDPQLLYYAHLCRGCRQCEAVCPSGAHRFDKDGSHRIDPALCTLCGRCEGVCDAGALKRVGRTVRVSEVMEEVLRDRILYEDSGGGLTLTGGEPLAQPSFAIALAGAAKKAGISVYLETSGFGSREALEGLSFLCDGILYDFKASAADHKALCGAEAGPIRANLHAFDSCGVPIILRCPIVPTMNLSPALEREIIETAKALKNLEEIHLLPYHRLGLSKARALGMDPGPAIPVPAKEEMEALRTRIEAAGKIPVKVM